MNYSNTEKKRIRKNFGKHNSNFNIPYLIALQIESFNKFIIKNKKTQKNIGNILKKFFPILNHNRNISLRCLDYKIIEPKYNFQECKDRGITYQGALKLLLQLIIYNKKNLKKIKFIKNRLLHMCDIPLITKNSTFVVNGIERVVISQLHRTPGVIFDSDKGKSNTFKKILYNARIIPYSGPWLDFEFDNKDILYIRIDRKKKIPATVILRALNYSPKQILNLFYDNIIFDIKDNIIKMNLEINKFENEIAIFDIISNNKIYVKKGEVIKKNKIKEIKKDRVKKIVVPLSFIYSKIIAKDYYNKKGVLICMANMNLSKEIIINLKKNGYKKVKVIFTNNINRGNYISNTLHFDPTYDRLSALIEIYHILKPEENATLEVASAFFQNLFFAGNKYNLSKVGRFKLNSSILRLDKCKSIYLEKEDIILIIKKMLNIRNGKDKIDDIDNLGNRRIRSVGEMVSNHFTISLMRIRGLIKEKLMLHKKLSFPKNLANFKILTIYIKDFFISNPLSQFMDQNNSLSAITHKRRISALGPGGLTIERANFEVRDIHSSHYGRICPIETPEGPNIGLINSLALYSQINKYGFLETPYRLVKKTNVTNEIYYLTSTEEENYVIAQANTKLNKKGKIVNKLINCRYKNETGLFDKKRVNYIDISNQQILSVGASLIPFMEHNDANRSLMGSNMQRQAIPPLITEKPIVGTGMERIIAADSGSIVLAKRGGTVKYLDSSKIIIKIDNKESINFKNNFDVYDLVKYTRSNQNTCINQKPCVFLNEKIVIGDVIADSSSTDMGELALGKNMRIAFMPWNGYNFEDSILISEKIVHQNRFTTLHIHELSCEIKDTKINSEKITTKIPGVSKCLFSKLDTNGIIKIGVEVSSGDILVSKIIKKKEKKLKSEEKLLFAIFGNKSPEIQDSSLRVPNGIYGKVIDVKIFKKKKKEDDEIYIKKKRKKIKKTKNKKTKNKKTKNKKTEKKLKKKTRIIKKKKIIIKKIKKIKKKKKIFKKEKLKNKLKKNIYFEKTEEKKKETENISVLYKIINIKKKKINILFYNCIFILFSYNNINLKIIKKVNFKKIFNFVLKNKFEELKLLNLIKLYNKLKEYKQLKIIKKPKKIKTNGINPGILKVIKIYIAIKHNIQPGDKIVGRHGNKGVISKINLTEDMPYDKNGIPIDIVLNPLGVPSRMNIGQILEVHLGMAAMQMGKKIEKMLKTQKTIFKIRKFIQKIYDSGYNNIQKINFNTFTDKEVLLLAENLTKGVPVASPVFDGAKEKEIKNFLKLSGSPTSGQITLFDGQTGEKFERPITVGYMYMLKLNHLVIDKIHARSTGSYSLVTQQPLKGKSKFGGQRVGEMEVWALEAYGAAYTLQEMLTIKSDDLNGRTKIYKKIINNKYYADPSVPESFNVLVKEMKSLGINVELYKNK